MYLHHEFDNSGDFVHRSLYHFVASHVLRQAKKFRWLILFLAIIRTCDKTPVTLSFFKKNSRVAALGTALDAFLMFDPATNSCSVRPYAMALAIISLFCSSFELITTKDKFTIQEIRDISDEWKLNSNPKFQFKLIPRALVEMFESPLREKMSAQPQDMAKHVDMLKKTFYSGSSTLPELLTKYAVPAHDHQGLWEALTAVATKDDDALINILYSRFLAGDEKIALDSIVCDRVQSWRHRHIVANMLIKYRGDVSQSIREQQLATAMGHINYILDHPDTPDNTRRVTETLKIELGGLQHPK